MDYLLQVKLAALFGLLFITLLCGFIPARLPWFRDTHGTERHRTVLSLISCFAGGVFLSACFLDIIPDYLSDISIELESRGLESDFPLPEFIMATGFFIVLVLERLVLTCRSRRGRRGETAPLLVDSRAGLGPEGGLDRDQDPNHDHSGHRDHREHHVHVDFQAHSSFRSFMLFLSLSLHSIFEGLAIGLQNQESKVLEICIAILVHKSIIVFSLSLKLVQSAVPPRWLAAYVSAFAVMSPLGIAVGVAVMESELPAGALVQAVLEGLAAGSFIYITFLEILPHELNAAGKQLLKTLFILLGFSVMATLSFLG